MFRADPRNDTHLSIGEFQGFKTSGRWYGMVWYIEKIQMPENGHRGKSSVELTAPPWKWAANHHVSGYNLFVLGSVPSPCIFAACFTLWEIWHFRQTSGDGTWVDSLKVFLKSQPDKMQRTKSTHFSLSTSISLRDPRWCFGILKDFTLNEIPQTSIHLVTFGMYSGSWMREG